MGRAQEGAPEKDGPGSWTLRCCSRDASDRSPVDCACTLAARCLGNIGRGCGRAEKTHRRTHRPKEDDPFLQQPRIDIIAPFTSRLFVSYYLTPQRCPKLTVCSITYGTNVECTGCTAESNPPGPSSGAEVYGPECIRRAGARTALSVVFELEATADRRDCIERDILSCKYV